MSITRPTRFAKVSRILIAAFMIGAFDAWQACYYPIGALGPQIAILYQLLLMLAAALAAVVCLYDRTWSLGRNSLAALATIPIAMISDNVSLDLQLMKPYVLFLPQSGFAWRLNVFSNSPFYPLASWVDLQTFAPGLIDGYVAAIAIAALYVSIQSTWGKQSSIVRSLHATLLLLIRNFTFRRRL